MKQNISTISDYDYPLPEQLIAQCPLSKREKSRLLVLHRDDGRIEHKRFFEIIEYLHKGDVLVLNDTKVFPAKIVGSKRTGGRVEALLIKKVKDTVWEMLLKTNRKLKENDSIYFLDNSVVGNVLCKNKSGSWYVEFKNGEDFTNTVMSVGSMPLPPYIKRSQDNKQLAAIDETRYQTVYAKNVGAIAAPTAGLHFSEELLGKIREKEITIASVTLHVGLGTFQTIKEEDYTKHTMHEEYYHIPQQTIDVILKAKSLGKKIFATGTSACRVLETVARNDSVQECSGWTDLFIYPPYNFKITDSLITNFHLQRTSLLLLVSAFAGKETIRNAYESAIERGYRFYSYGDCMLIT
ncbi:MAG: tRNA preQ1(34) S-adenosylmethionine ribosyltransferase-isomerase QueA [Candidatus Scalindua sp. AMX11]|nr:MAG: tRNA preQ1(34) S-adenosylmethionine ribosyltransferase-isomerase QueA [Candidatus Scalindua sp.]NOG85595.1 tRNA preQ1(34) S-adenosylmethionine ribosyltransferase-isomerase QueA [Planctomycetota bacterium]RZV65362.1 MAG: tRNA preQ1(34) S-adenosylmethionine ribosyltransferase-isomerase QueA [Candidatus Scalindua sp. SCAELEC01]TDE63484.1 MAG: tRNA preQ1(34) S-adenosylmethionine ribosyltransferase-isomerase QueA [Candidatus Scalindua sp. AMX11]GJQ57303.1 MAG: S-adenosylmethionine:tRNA ribos